MNTQIYSDKMLDSMKAHLDENVSKYITYPKFIFLCGKAYLSKPEYEESNRGIIEKYIRAKLNNVFFVLSEKLWEDKFNSNIDLLTFEEFLAEVSDKIVLFVESPGSFCELGAFAYADKLFSDKLIIVIDEKFEQEKSFIITGPTAKAKSDGAKVIYAPLYGTGLLSSSSLRTAVDDIVKQLSSKSNNVNKRVSNQEETAVSINSFIAEILELIKLSQPISRRDLIELYKSVKGFSAFKFIKKDGNEFHNEIKIDYIFKLLETVNLIQFHDGLISCESFSEVQPLMFSYSKFAENKERNKLLCRKYRYRGKVK